MRMKRLLTSLSLVGLLALCPFRPARAQEKEPVAVTRKTVLNRLQDERSMSFVYDASLPVDGPYTGRPVYDLPLESALELLFHGTGITWKIKGRYVMLNKEKKVFTLNGYVYQQNGETLINATVFDRQTGKGTLTNAYGYYSFTLPEGSHRLLVSYVGFRDTVLTVNLDRNLTKNVYLEDLPSLQEVVVTGDLNAPLYTVQTGKVTLSNADLNTEFALLSSPDLIKSLQRLPGVTSGTELISGLYVHGGTNDGNLFLLDGNPIYQVNHLGGLFSAFNTDIVKTVDFYKSGFPARYGGRLSSVVDVRTNDGDMKKFHGVFSIGLLDGRIQLEGPLVKDKTSFNFAMRRSWLDLFTAPAIGIYNLKHKDEPTNLRYAFHDVNAKLTHRFSDRSRVYLSFYSGSDVMKIRSKYIDRFNFMPNADKEIDDNRFKLRWGNLTASANWNYVFSPRLFANLTLVYARNRTNYQNYSDDRYFKDEAETGVVHTDDRSRSAIDDTGYRMAFDYQPSSSHHVRFGTDYLHHAFRPQNNYFRSLTGEGENRLDTLDWNTSHFYDGNELTLYAEDEIRVLPRWKVNLGLHYTFFCIQRKTYHSAEPRAAMQVDLGKGLAAKLSYTEMSQFVHQLSNTYLNLPTDYWVPVTRRVRPMRSCQWAAGLYARLPFRMQAAVEGYYKTMDRMLEYDGGNSLTPAIENWEDCIHRGKGRAYGMEVSLSYAGANTSAELAYTLSWSERKFEVYNQGGWYPDRFDNRHKLNLTVRHRFSRKVEAYAAWTYHTGDRTTAPTQEVESPVFPDQAPAGSQLPVWIDRLPNTQWVYEKLNNVRLPAYHRLDIGMNFRHFTKRGHERIWNVSVYNAYSRMNPLYVEVEQKKNGGYVGKATGIFPIIPSFSYTLKF